MADKKISALTSATTPLAGTEVLPIVQSSTTVKVPVSDLTAGRTVLGTIFSANISNPGSYAFNGAVNQVGGDTTGNSTWTLVSSTTGIGYLSFADGTSGAARYAGRIDYNHSTNSMGFYTNGGVEAQVIDSSQNVKFSVGNLVQGTAAKGVDFTANTPAAGMTSQLLNWYEEGQYTATLTPSASGSISLYGTTQTLQYTRIGRLVTVTGGVQVSGVSSPTGYIKLNLPFNVSNLAQQSSRVTGSIVVDASAVANANDFVLYATNGATTVDIYLGTGTVLSATSANSIGTNSQLIFAFTYIAA